MFVIGLMSGTSLDGLDVAYCRFGGSVGGVSDFELLAAETYPYPDEWVRTLSNLEHASAYEYALAHVRLGHYFGQKVNVFRSCHSGPVDLVASHGHTVFHQPELGLTTQIGDGDALAAETGLPVAFNFRTLDVALGGQGAPLVPIGDRLLYARYDACLNLGGISNISFERESQRMAFDISPCNMALNLLARREGMAFDRDGAMARSGIVLPSLLARMDALSYYRQPSPKSLGKEWFVSQFEPLLDSAVPVPNLLRTCVEHVARQIADVVNTNGIRTLLATGGGARNKFLMDRFAALAPKCNLCVPDAQMVDYKEAIVFALLGFLRVQGQHNTLASVTGARTDSVGGNLSGII